MTAAEILRAILEGVIAVAAVYGAYQGKMVHLTINSRMDQLLSVSKTAARLEGAETQRTETAAENAAKDAT